MHGDRSSDDAGVAEFLSHETRHNIVQTVLGHPTVLASAEEIDYYVADTSRECITEQLERLVEENILTIYEYPLNRDTEGLPWRFYSVSEDALAVLDECNYLKGVPLSRAIHLKTRKSEEIERHETAPRPALADAVRAAFRLHDED
jgi:hypothetical protein